MTSTIARTTCPSWCEDAGDCRGEHHGKTWGTVASGGLPPIVDSPEAPFHNTACVAAQHDELDGLPPGVTLFGCWAGGQDWQVDLTIAEARAIATAILERCDQIDGEATAR